MKIYAEDPACVLSLPVMRGLLLEEFLDRFAVGWAASESLGFLHVFSIIYEVSLQDPNELHPCLMIL